MAERSLRGRRPGNASMNSQSHGTRHSQRSLQEHHQIIPSSVTPHPLRRQPGHPRMQMKSPSLDEKIAFFDRLDALDNVSEEDDRVDEKEQAHRDHCRAFFRSRTKARPARESAPETAASI